MKYATMTALAFALAQGSCWAEESTAGNEPNGSTSELTSDQDKVLYSLGYELGKDLQRQQLELKSKLVLKGAEDALSGSKPLINPQQRQLALKQIQDRRAQENLAQSLAFLGANAEKDGIKVLASGLQYREIQTGEGKTPGPKDNVRVHYKGSLIDGREFDSSYKRGKPATFRVNQVIKGWQEALQLMKEGSKWELYIPPELAYGKRGRPNTIPSNSTLIFEVELLRIL